MSKAERVEHVSTGQQAEGGCVDIAKTDWTLAEDFFFDWLDFGMNVLIKEIILV